MATGSSVGGATTVTSAPSVFSSRTLDRATRLWRTSPTIVTRRPSSSPRRLRIVNASRSAWVGCSCVPSPLLTTLPCTQPTSRCGAPEAPCRMTTPSAPIASRVSAVSFRLSPLDTLDPFAEKLITSADSRSAAASNEIRVRVESSKNRLTTVRPRSVGSFLMERPTICASSSAVSRTSSASSFVRSAAEIRWRFIRHPRRAQQHGPQQDRVAPVVLVQQHLHRLAHRGGQVLPT